MLESCLFLIKGCVEKMKITVKTVNNKTLYNQLGEETLQKMIPYVDKIFATVGGKTEEIIVDDDSYDRALMLRFLSVIVVDGLFEVTLSICIMFSLLGSGYLAPDERILNMHSFVVPKFDNKVLQLVQKTAKKFGNINGFRTYYSDRFSKDTYDSQMQKLVNDYNNHFERDIELYRKAVEFLMLSDDSRIFVTLPSVREIFVF